MHVGVHGWLSTAECGVRYTLDLSLTPDSFKPKVGPNKWGKQTIEEYTKQYWLSQDIAMLQAARPIPMWHDMAQHHRHNLFVCVHSLPHTV